MTEEDVVTPGKAIRKFCLACVDGSYQVQDCQGNQMVDGPCALYKFRMGRGRPSVKTIRKHCLYCCNHSLLDVRECPDEKCTLHKFRMGKNPNFSSANAENLFKSDT